MPGMLADMHDKNMGTSLQEALNKLKSYKELHLQRGKSIADPYKGAIYPFDICAVAALHRSLNILNGTPTIKVPIPDRMSGW